MESQSKKFIKDLAELSKRDLSAAGGKGANLGELVRAGLPVPQGFVVTTAGYDRFVADHGLKDVIDANLSRKNGGAAIRRAFQEAAFPNDIKTELGAAYRKLGGGAVAVRSSATAEDLPEAAFAGQQETYLNIHGEQALYNAVRQTWASLWTDRAIAYRKRFGIDQRTVRIAVVVQRMVDAEFAGVMFTAHPVTGNRRETVFDITPGLGEAIVSGMVTPEHVVLRRRPFGWRVVERRAGRFETVIEPKRDGGTKQTKWSGEHALLSQQVLIELARLGEKIAAHFSAPQDIEWAWAGGKAWIVQSRPITALPDEIARQNRINRMFAGIIAEMLPERPLPLEATTLGPTFLLERFLKPFFQFLGFRPLGVEDLFAVQDGILVRYRGKLSFRPTPHIVFLPFRIAALAIQWNPKQWKDDPLLEKTVEELTAFGRKQYADFTPRALIAVIREVLMLVAPIFTIRIRYLPRTAMAVVGVRMLLLLARRGDLLGTLLYADIKTKVTETNHALESLAATIRSDKTLTRMFREYEAGKLLPELRGTGAAKDFLAAFEEFLETYGYRESGGTLLISEPTWKESPETVLRILKSLAATPQRKKTRQSFTQLRDGLVTESVLRFPPLKQLFLKLLQTARNFHKIREDTRFYIMMAVPPLRRALFALAARLKEAGVVREAHDIFYLQFHEIEEAVDALPLEKQRVEEVRSRIVRRKATYAKLQRTPFVDPRLYRTAADKGEALLSGNPGSPGEAEGPARIIHKSAEFDTLQLGEVLVAPYTNPAWTPLFAKASAVVVDTGGMMSHAAIVAREYGLPAVMGTGEGTEKIKTGQYLRVDGTKGRVFTADAPTDH